MTTKVKSYCYPFTGFFDIHPWVGTDHCFRDKDKGCANDHTGCMWNDSHNRCMHPAPDHIVCPLRTKDTREYR